MSVGPDNQQSYGSIRELFLLFYFQKDPSDNDQDSNCSSKSATKTNKTKVKRLKSKSAFKCRLCEKVCSSFYKLQRHMSSHGMNKVKCNLCDKSISFKDHLEVHLKGKHPEIYVKINKLYSKVGNIFTYVFFIKA